VEANHRDRLLVVVTGLPGTGKSTVADAAGRHLGAAVLAHDWAMSGLRPFPDLQAALDGMNPPGHGPVGWSILLSLARAQLRRDGTVVLEGVARAREIELIRKVAAEEQARPVVIMTQCVDVDVHRSRIEGRDRGIPNWYELDWSHVQRARDGWEPIDDVELTLEATEPLVANLDRLRIFLDRLLGGWLAN
jgi:predicted kinase